MRFQLTPVLGAIGLLIAAFVLSGCKRHDYLSDGSFIDLRLTVASSPDEIERRFRDVVAGRYENPTNGLSIYQVSSSSSHFVFLQAYNYPRGLPIFSLYCYEQTAPDKWRLRSFVPVNEDYFTNDYTRALRFDVEGENVNAVYRGLTVFTVTGTKTNSNMPLKPVAQ
jgi:hypothetical protein